MLPPRTAEARALEVARALPGDRVLGVTLGRVQTLAALAEERPAGRAVCWMLDEHHANLARQSALPANLSIVCAADPPEEPFDLAVVPVSMRGEAELARETLQELAQRLSPDGVLVAASDNPRDSWLRQQMDALLPGVRLHRFSDAVVYSVVKQQPLKRRRDFSCEFAFRDRQRLLQAVSRPGVFSHRRVDPGARRLLEALEEAAGENVLEIGCGAGVVSLALAAHLPQAQVLAVDSHTRAVQCTQRGAELNALPNLRVLCNATGEYPAAGTFDLAIANPPYYADHAIAQRMMAAAARSLKPAGRLLVVTKTPGWYFQQLDDATWGSLQTEEVKRYHLVRAIRR
ncbi:class I SAM-dependent methyltransferase [Botrimarina hoheduenensis]|uniref:Ribosomal RNA small subunit methyltransferase C n=1 Tax=Botrimarina hoheduenensis TaxID=2528000 RepID=A0A5C5WE36_9BACT|nr:methyltransferase [Botrimarina hoheduenensis]TWT48413.1 Ribosomal RNA small subunit methyltransferase C [Botrimarina hoheduenensis]